MNQWSAELATFYYAGNTQEEVSWGIPAPVWDLPKEKGLELGLRPGEMLGFQGRSKRMLLLERVSQRSVLPKVPEFHLSFFNQQLDKNLKQKYSCERQGIYSLGQIQKKKILAPQIVTKPASQFSADLLWEIKSSHISNSKILGHSLQIKISEVNPLRIVYFTSENVTVLVWVHIS